MNYPLVSCITPTYGRIHLLQEMYWSWCQQSYPNKELIIVNDQNNLTITSTDFRVKVFNFDKRFIGLGAKRNFCVEQTSPEAKYIMPFDDDDLFLPEHISSLVDGLEKYPTFHRAKNLQHVLINDNMFKEILVGPRPFFGASCFQAHIMRHFKFKDEYVMGEDTTWLDGNGITTHFIARSTPTFLYRIGMNIIHASWHASKMDIHSQSEQVSLYNKIGNSAARFALPTTVELTANVTRGTENLYKIMLAKYK
jgi:glycosyltransferase involved in cell wall biosynthesis